MILLLVQSHAFGTISFGQSPSSLTDGDLTPGAPASAVHELKFRSPVYASRTNNQYALGFYTDQGWSDFSEDPARLVAHGTLFQPQLSDWYWFVRTSSPFISDVGFDNDFNYDRSYKSLTQWIILEVGDPSSKVANQITVSIGGREYISSVPGLLARFRLEIKKGEQLNVAMRISGRRECWAFGENEFCKRVPTSNGGETIVMRPGLALDNIHIKIRPWAGPGYSNDTTVKCPFDPQDWYEREPHAVSKYSEQQLKSCVYDDRASFISKHHQDFVIDNTGCFFGIHRNRGHLCFNTEPNNPKFTEYDFFDLIDFDTWSAGTITNTPEHQRPRQGDSDSITDSLKEERTRILQAHLPVYVEVIQGLSFLYSGSDGSPFNYAVNAHLFVSHKPLWVRWYAGNPSATWIEKYGNLAGTVECTGFATAVALDDNTDINKKWKRTQGMPPERDPSTTPESPSHEANGGARPEAVKAPRDRPSASPYDGMSTNGPLNLTRARGVRYKNVTKLKRERTIQLDYWNMYSVDVPIEDTKPLKSYLLQFTPSSSTFSRFDLYIRYTDKVVPFPSALNIGVPSFQTELDGNVGVTQIRLDPCDDGPIWIWLHKNGPGVMSVTIEMIEIFTGGLIHPCAFGSNVPGYTFSRTTVIAPVIIDGKEEVDLVSNRKNVYPYVGKLRVAWVHLENFRERYIRVSLRIDNEPIPRYESELMIDIGSHEIPQEKCSKHSRRYILWLHDSDGTEIAHSPPFYMYGGLDDVSSKAELLGGLFAMDSYGLVKHGSEFKLPKETFTVSVGNSDQFTARTVVYKSMERRLVVVSQRGTVGTIDDWAVNIDTTQVPCSRAIEGCSGNVIENPLTEYITTQDWLHVTLDSASALDEEFTFIVCGHSQGAALATITAVDIAMKFNIPKERMFLVTFGQPWIGDSDFAEQLNAVVQHYAQFVLQDDTLASWEDPITVLPSLGYAHLVLIFPWLEIPPIAHIDFFGIERMTPKILLTYERTVSCLPFICWDIHQPKNYLYALMVDQQHVFGNLPDLPPFNDRCEGAFPIPGDEFPAESPVVNTWLATKKDDLVMTCFLDTGAGVWFSFTPSVSRTYSFTCICHDGWERVMAIYSSSSDCSDLQQITCQTEICQDKSIEVSLNSGVTYYVLVAKSVENWNFPSLLAKGYIQVQVRLSASSPTTTPPTQSPFDSMSSCGFYPGGQSVSGKDPRDDARFLCEFRLPKDSFANAASRRQRYTLKFQHQCEWLPEILPIPIEVVTLPQTVVRVYHWRDNSGKEFHNAVDTSWFGQGLGGKDQLCKEQHFLPRRSCTKAQKEARLTFLKLKSAELCDRLYATLFSVNFDIDQCKQFALGSESAGLTLSNTGVGDRDDLASAVLRTLNNWLQVDETGGVPTISILYLGEPMSFGALLPFGNYKAFPTGAKVWFTLPPLSLTESVFLDVNIDEETPLLHLMSNMRQGYDVSEVCPLVQLEGDPCPTVTDLGASLAPFTRAKAYKLSRADEYSPAGRVLPDGGHSPLKPIHAAYFLETMARTNDFTVVGLLNRDRSCSIASSLDGLEDQVVKVAGDTHLLSELTPIVPGGYFTLADPSRETLLHRDMWGAIDTKVNAYCASKMNCKLTVASGSAYRTAVLQLGYWFVWRRGFKTSDNRQCGAAFRPAQSQHTVGTAVDLFGAVDGITNQVAIRARWEQILNANSDATCGMPVCFRREHTHGDGTHFEWVPGADERKARVRASHEAFITLWNKFNPFDLLDPATDIIETTSERQPWELSNGMLLRIAQSPAAGFLNPSTIPDRKGRGSTFPSMCEHLYFVETFFAWETRSRQRRRDSHGQVALVRVAPDIESVSVRSLSPIAEAHWQVSADTPESSPLKIVLFSASGLVHSEYRLFPLAQSFSFFSGPENLMLPSETVIPWSSDITEWEVRHMEENVIERVTKGALPVCCTVNSVHLQSPVEPLSTTSGLKLTLRWTAQSHPTPVYNIHYRCDSETRWHHIIETGLSEIIVELDQFDHCDSVQFSVASSDAFSVSESHSRFYDVNRAPAFPLTPVVSFIATTNGTLKIFEDGCISVRTLHWTDFVTVAWTSSLQGFLGVTESTLCGRLNPGTHNVTASAASRSTTYETFAIVIVAPLEDICPPVVFSDGRQSSVNMRHLIKWVPPSLIECSVGVLAASTNVRGSSFAFTAKLPGSHRIAASVDSNCQFVVAVHHLGGDCVGDLISCHFFRLDTRTFPPIIRSRDVTAEVDLEAGQTMVVLLYEAVGGMCAPRARFDIQIEPKLFADLTPPPNNSNGEEPELDVDVDERPPDDFELWMMRPVLSPNTDSSTEKGSCGGSGPEHIYLYRAPATGRVLFQIPNADFDTFMYVRNGAIDGAELDCNDDIQVGVNLKSRLNLFLKKNQTVYLFVDSSLGSPGGRYNLTVQSQSCGDAVEIPWNASLPHVETGVFSDQVSMVRSGCGGARQQMAFLWTVPSDASYVIDSTGSQFPSHLAVMTGECTGEEITCKQGSEPTFRALSTFWAFAGQRVSILLGTSEFTQEPFNYTLVIREASRCPMHSLDSATFLRINGTTSGAFAEWEGRCKSVGQEVTYSYVAPEAGSYTFVVHSEFQNALPVIAVRDGSSCGGGEMACSVGELVSEYHLTQKPFAPRVAMAEVSIDLVQGQHVIVFVDYDRVTEWAQSFQLVIYKAPLRCPIRQLPSVVPQTVQDVLSWCPPGSSADCIDFYIYEYREFSLGWVAPFSGKFVFRAASTFDGFPARVWVRTGCGASDSDLACGSHLREATVTLTAGQSVVIFVATTSAVRSGYFLLHIEQYNQCQSTILPSEVPYVMRASNNIAPNYFYRGCGVSEGSIPEQHFFYTVPESGKYLIEAVGLSRGTFFVMVYDEFKCVNSAPEYGCSSVSQPAYFNLMQGQQITIRVEGNTKCAFTLLIRKDEGVKCPQIVLPPSTRTSLQATTQLGSNRFQGCCAEKETVLSFTAPNEGKFVFSMTPDISTVYWRPDMFLREANGCTTDSTFLHETKGNAWHDPLSYNAALWMEEGREVLIIVDGAVHSGVFTIEVHQETCLLTPLPSAVELARFMRFEGLDGSYGYGGKYGTDEDQGSCGPFSGEDFEVSYSFSPPEAGYYVFHVKAEGEPTIYLRSETCSGPEIACERSLLRVYNPTPPYGGRWDADVRVSREAGQQTLLWVDFFHWGYDQDIHIFRHECPEIIIPLNLPQNASAIGIVVEGNTRDGYSLFEGSCVGPRGDGLERSFLFTCQETATYRIIMDGVLHTGWGPYATPVLYVREMSANSSCDGTELACNRGSNHRDDRAEVVLPLEKGHQYVIFADAYYGSSQLTCLGGEFQLNVRQMLPCPQYDVVLGETLSASSELADPSHVSTSASCPSGGPETSMRFTAPHTGRFVVTLTPGSGYTWKSRLVVATGSCDGPTIVCEQPSGGFADTLLSLSVGEVIFIFAENAESFGYSFDVRVAEFVEDVKDLTVGLVQRGQGTGALFEGSCSGSTAGEEAVYRLNLSETDHYLFHFNGNSPSLYLRTGSLWGSEEFCVTAPRRDLYHTAQLLSGIDYYLFVEDSLRARSVFTTIVNLWRCGQDGTLSSSNQRKLISTKNPRILMTACNVESSEAYYSLNFDPWATGTYRFVAQSGFPVSLRMWMTTNSEQRCTFPVLQCSQPFGNYKLDRSFASLDFVVSDSSQRYILFLQGTASYPVHQVSVTLLSRSCPQTVLSGPLPLEIEGDLTVAPMSHSSGSCGTGGTSVSGPDESYSFRAPSTGTFIFSVIAHTTTGTSFQSTNLQLYARDGTLCSGVELGCSISKHRRTFLSLELEANQQIVLFVDVAPMDGNAVLRAGPYSLFISKVEPPVQIATEASGVVMGDTRSAASSFTISGDSSTHGPDVIYLTTATKSSYVFQTLPPLLLVVLNDNENVLARGSSTVRVTDLVVGQPLKLVVEGHEHTGGDSFSLRWTATAPSAVEPPFQEWLPADAVLFKGNNFAFRSIARIPCAHSSVDGTSLALSIIRYQPQMSGRFFFAVASEESWVPRIAVRRQSDDLLMGCSDGSIFLRTPDLFVELTVGEPILVYVYGKPTYDIFHPDRGKWGGDFLLHIEPEFTECFNVDLGARMPPFEIEGNNVVSQTAASMCPWQSYGTQSYKWTAPATALFTISVQELTEPFLRTTWNALLVVKPFTCQLTPCPWGTYSVTNNWPPFTRARLTFSAVLGEDWIIEVHGTTKPGYFDDTLPEQGGLFSFSVIQVPPCPVGTNFLASGTDVSRQNRRISWHHSWIKPSCAEDQPEVIYRYKAPTAGYYLFRAHGTDFEEYPTLYVLDGSTCSGTELGCSALEDSLQEVLLYLTENQEVTVVVEFYSRDPMYTSTVRVSKLACPSLPLVEGSDVSGSTHRNDKETWQPIVTHNVLEVPCNPDSMHLETAYSFVADHSGLHFFVLFANGYPALTLRRDDCWGQLLDCATGTFRVETSADLVAGQRVAVVVDGWRHHLFPYPDFFDYALRVSRNAIGICDVEQHVDMTMLPQQFKASTKWGSASDTAPCKPVGDSIPEAVFQMSPIVSGVYLISVPNEGYGGSLWIREGHCGNSTAGDIPCTRAQPRASTEYTAGAHLLASLTGGRDYFVKTEVSAFGTFEFEISFSRFVCPSTKFIVENVGDTVRGETHIGQNLFHGSCGGELNEKVFVFTPNITDTYTFTLRTEGRAYRTTTAPIFDGAFPVLYIRDGSCFGTELVCQRGPLSLTSTVSLPLTAGKTVFIFVDGDGEELHAGGLSFYLSLDTQCQYYELSASVNLLELPRPQDISIDPEMWSVLSSTNLRDSYPGDQFPSNLHEGTCGGAGGYERIFTWKATGTGTWVVVLLLPRNGAGYSWNGGGAVLYVRDGLCDGPEVQCAAMESRLDSRVSLEFQATSVGQLFSIFVDSDGVHTGSFLLLVRRPITSAKRIPSGVSAVVRSNPGLWDASYSDSCSKHILLPEAIFEFTAGPPGSYAIRVLSVNNFQPVLSIRKGAIDAPSAECYTGFYAPGKLGAYLMVHLESREKLYIFVEGTLTHPHEHFDLEITQRDCPDVALPLEFTTTFGDSRNRDMKLWPKWTGPGACAASAVGRMREISYGFTAPRLGSYTFTATPLEPAYSLSLWAMDGCTCDTSATQLGCVHPGTGNDAVLAFNMSRGQCITIVVDSNYQEYWSGFFGGPFTLSMNVTANTCPADLDGDAEIGVTDLAILLIDWGSTSMRPADINNDGVVDLVDLATLLVAWGRCALHRGDTPTVSHASASSNSPTEAPSKQQATASPTAARGSPTKNQSSTPTASPTAEPTNSPTAGPSNSPTVSPSAQPTVTPGSPTRAPTIATSGTAAPTQTPSTASATSAPSSSPTTSAASGLTTDTAWSSTATPTGTAATAVATAAPRTGLSGGAIAGIATGALVLAGIVTLLIIKSRHK